MKFEASLCCLCYNSGDLFHSKQRIERATRRHMHSGVLDRLVQNPEYPKPCILQEAFGGNNSFRSAKKKLRTSTKNYPVEQRYAERNEQHCFGLIGGTPSATTNGSRHTLNSPLLSPRTTLSPRVYYCMNVPGFRPFLFHYCAPKKYFLEYGVTPFVGLHHPKTRVGNGIRSFTHSLLIKDNRPENYPPCSYIM